MGSLEITLEQRLLLMPLIFFTAFAILVLVHRRRHQAGWVLKERLAQFFLVGASMLLLGAFLTILLETEERVAREFHRLYHDKWYESTILQTRWKGVRLLKCPLDLWVVQEIVHETKPDVIIETGTWRGGSAYYFASLFDIFGKGRVLTVDIGPIETRGNPPRESSQNRFSAGAPFRCMAGEGFRLNPPRPRIREGFLDGPRSRTE